ncbi:MAG: hypothetical protein CSA65_02525 [Proteobacteria bacterium]|nr:MAG: hypothetical protein CSA65_02525 [Pseudomonadota bacterium]
MLCASPATAQRIEFKTITPQWSFKPSKGFVDDAMAFDVTGQRFAYIHTDSATFLDVVIIGVGDWKQQLKISVPGATKVPASLAFSADGSRLVFIWADTRTGKQGVELFDLSKGGKLITSAKDASTIALVEYKGQQVLSVAKERQDKRGNVRVSVSLHRLADLKRIKRAKLKVGVDTRIKRPPLRVLYWERGHLSLVGVRKGKYDRKRDVRRPDVAIRWDILERKQLWAQEPKDLVKWNRAISFRNNHSGANSFVHVGESLKTLYLVDRNNQLKAIKTPVKWRLYEPRSLKQRESWDGNTLYFSMTIDPVNPEAVARKKADKERADIYHVDASGKVKSIGRIFTGKRRFGWVVGKGRFAYLRKLKGFGRGGKSVEIHAIGAGL